MHYYIVLHPRFSAWIPAQLTLAVRRLVRAKGFAALAVGTLAIGVSINTSMLALIDALLLRPPFDVAHPEEVVGLRFKVGDSAKPVYVNRCDYPTAVEVGRTDAFAAFAVYTTASVSVGVGADASLANAMLVSRDFFRVMQPRPLYGTLDLGDSDVQGAGNRAVISYGYWQRQFGGEPRLIGTTLRIDERTYTIAGIARAGFQSLSERPIDVWLPLDHTSAARAGPNNWREKRGSFWLNAAARLKPATSAALAEEKVNAMLRTGAATVGDTPTPTAVVSTSIVPGRSGPKSLEVRVALWLTGISVLVLLIACSNVSNLVLARAFAQRREYFVRAALGASTFDLAQRLVADVCVIVIPSTIGAIALSFLIRNGISAFLSADIPLSRQFWDFRTAVIALASASIAFGLLCSVSLMQLRAVASTQELHAGVAGARHVGKKTRGSLLGLQTGLSLVLLFVAGLFTKSLRRTDALDLGVDLDRTIQATLSAGSTQRSPAAIRAIYEDATAALAKHPLVERVAIAESSPYMSGQGAAPWTKERGKEQLWADGEVAYRSTVGSGFFAAVGAKSLRGRDFKESDRAGAELVAIINAPLAKHLWPSNKNPIGECMWLDSAATCYRIVGVLAGVWKFSALERNKMAMYLPLAQVQDAVPGAIFVRSRIDARQFLSEARPLIQSIRPDLPAVRVVAARDVVAPEFRAWRLGATVFSASAVIALIIASTGLYGVVAVVTVFRLKEIGIRVSLGARWTHIAVTVIGESVVSVTIGLVAGTLVAAGLSHSLGGILFETSPTDLEVIAQTALILFIVSAAALVPPTMRALGTDPATILRAD